MADIDLSVGLHTKTALKNANELIKSLDDVEKVGNEVEKTYENLTKKATALSTAFRTGKTSVSGYRVEINKLKVSQRTLGRSLGDTYKKVAALDSIFTKGSGSLEKYGSNFDKLNRQSKDLSKKLISSVNDIRTQTGKVNATFRSIGKNASSLDPMLKTLSELNKKLYTAGMLAMKVRDRLSGFRVSKSLTRDVSTGGGAQVDKLIADNKKLETSLNSVKDKLKQTQQGLKDYNGTLRKGRKPLAGAARYHKELNPVLSDQVGFWRFAGRAAALYFSSLVTTRLLDVVIQFEALEQSLIAISGSTINAAEDMQFLNTVADQLGFTTLELGKGYKLLTASAKGTVLEGAAIDAIFKSVVSSSRALGLTNADTEGSLRALSQTIAKGTVQAEELKGQLGERLPGAFQLAAKAMGVTTEELGKMLEQGELMAVELLPKLAMELNKTFVPTQEMLDGPQASINRMKEAFQQLGITLGEAGFTEGLARFANSLAEIAQSETVVKVVKALGGAFNFLSKNSELLLAGLTAGLTAWFSSQAAVTKLNFSVNSLTASFAANSLAVQRATGSTITYASVVGGATTAVRTLGAALKMAIPLLGSLFAGFSIGDWLQEEYAVVQDFGRNMVRIFVNAKEGITGAFNALGVAVDAIWNRITASVKGAAFSLADVILEQLERLAKGVDFFTGTDISAGIENIRENLSNIGASVVKKDLEGIQDVTKGMANAINEAAKNIRQNNTVFNGMASDLRRIEEAADAANMSVGEYTKMLEERRKSELRMAEAAKEVAKHEKALQEAADRGELQGRIDFVKEQTKDFKELIAELDPVNEKIHDLTKELNQYKKVQEELPKSQEAASDLLSRLRGDLQALNKELESKAALENADHMKDLQRQVRDVEARIEETKNSLNSMPEAGANAAKGIRLVNIELEQLKKQSDVSSVRESLNIDENFREAGRSIDKFVDTINTAAKGFGKAETEAQKISSTIDDIKKGMDAFAGNQRSYKNKLEDLSEEYTRLTNAAQVYSENDLTGKELEALAARDKILKQMEEIGVELEEMGEAADITAGVLARLKKAYEEASKPEFQKSFEETSRSISDQTKELKATIHFTKLFNDAEIGALVAKEDWLNLSEKQIEQLVRQQKELKKTAAIAENVNAFENAKDLGNITKGIGDSIGDAITSGDWGKVGDEIGSRISEVASTGLAAETSKLFSGVGGLVGNIAGPIGSAVGSIGGALFDKAFEGVADIFSGGNVPDPTERRQATQGTGTVFGNISAKSDAIARATEITSSATEDLVGINTSMLRSLESLQMGIEGASRLITRQGSESIPEIDRINENLFSNLGTVGDVTGGFLDVLGSFFTGGLFNDLGKVIGKALGGSSKKIDEGITIVGDTIANLTQNTVAEAFAEFKTRKNFLDDYDVKRRSKPLSDAVNNQFSLVFDDIFDTVIAGGLGFGFDEENLKSQLGALELGDIDISTEGLTGAEIQQELEAVFGKAFDTMVAETMPFVEHFVRQGETLGTTLARLSAEMESVRFASEAIGFDIETGESGQLENQLAAIKETPEVVRQVLGLTVEEFRQYQNNIENALAEGQASIADNLVSAFGGDEGFRKATSDFVGKFASEERQFSLLSDNIISAFDQVNLELPKTRQELFDLAGAQKAYTETGAENLKVILKNTGALDSYFKQVETWTDELNKLGHDLLGRAPTGEEIDVLVERLKNGTTTIGEIADDVKNSQEYLDKTGKEFAQSLTDIANNFLGRAPTGDELDHFIGKLQEGSITLQEIGDIAANSLEGRMFAAAPEARDLAIRKAELLGNEEEALALKREKQLEGTHELNRATLKEIFALEDEMKTKEDLSDLRIRLANAEGDTLKAVQLAREKELSTATDSERALLLQIFHQEDLNRLKEEEAKLNDLQIRLLKTQGKDLQALALTRQKELESATDAEKAILRQIYAAEDANRLADEAADREQARIDALNESRSILNDYYQEEANNLEQVRGKLRGIADSLRDFRLDLDTGGLSALNPEDQFAAAKREFEQVSALARSGDMDARSRLQEVAQTFLEESREFQGTGGSFAQDFEAVREIVRDQELRTDAEASQAARQIAALEKQIESLEQNRQEQEATKQAIISLIQVQQEIGNISRAQQERIVNSLSVLESNSELENSR